MHVLLSLIAILFVWFKGVWKDWQQYHTTMLYIVMMDLLYKFLTANHYLWRMKSDFPSNYTFTEILHTFIILPATTLLFLSNYPKKLIKQIAHNVTYIVIYIGMEWIIGVKMQLIEYQHGWNIGWSILFVCMMFPMLRFHYKKPLLAYSLSFFIIIGWLILFEIPVHLPIEQRE